jgi:hypothetical protein
MVSAKFDVLSKRNIFLQFEEVVSYLKISLFAYLRKYYSKNSCSNDRRVG